MSDTPETDAYLKKYCIDDSTDVVLLDFSRKLERERNEARNITGFALNKDYYEKHQKVCAELETVKAERDQLRKVADELAERLNAIASYHVGTPMSESARRLLSDSYNSLPHVIERNKSK